MQTVARSRGSGVEQVRRLLLGVVRDLRPFRRDGRFGLGHHDLGEHEGGRCGHEARGQEVPRVVRTENADVDREDRAGDRRESAGHQGHQLRLRHRVDVGPHDEGRFRLTDKDVGGHRQRLRTRNLQGQAHRRRENLHQELHNPQVVEDRHQCGKVDDRGQRAEGERDRRHVSFEPFRDGRRLRREERNGLVGIRADGDDVPTRQERAEDHPGPLFAEPEDRGREARELREDRCPDRRLQNDQREGELQHDAAQHDPDVDALLVRGQEPGNTAEEEQAKEGAKDRHGQGDEVLRGRQLIPESLDGLLVCCDPTEPRMEGYFLGCSSLPAIGGLATPHHVQPSSTRHARPPKPRLRPSSS